MNYEQNSRIDAFFVDTAGKQLIAMYTSRLPASGHSINWSSTRAETLPHMGK